MATVAAHSSGTGSAGPINSRQQDPINIRGRDLQSFTAEPTDINDVIIINVGGVKHEVLQTTLSRIPNTRLAQLKTTCQAYYRKKKAEYYFDRHPGTFAAILNLYRTGELHVPNDCCGPLFRAEMNFWRISEEEIEQCCWVKYNSELDQKNSLIVFKDYHAHSDDTSSRYCAGKWGKWRDKIWKVIDSPFSSKAAMVYAFISYAIVAVSIVGLIVESHPIGQVPLTIENYAEYLGMDDLDDVRAYLNSTELELHPQTNPMLYKLDVFCICFFTIEWTARLVFCPSVLAYLKNPFTILDFMAMVPFYIELTVHEFMVREKYKLSFVDKLFMLYVLRIFKMFRLVMHFNGFKVIAYTLKASWRELLLLLFCLVIQMVFFGSLIYIAEHGSGTTFTNIPVGLWWAIVTMTTVGYGDMYPTTPGGYVVGGLCAIFGVIVIAFTVPTMVNNFMLFYNAVLYQRIHPTLAEPDMDQTADENGKTNTKTETTFIEANLSKPTAPSGDSQMSTSTNALLPRNSETPDSDHERDLASFASTSSYIQALQANTRRFQPASSKQSY